MSLRSRKAEILLIATAIFTLAACDREERHSRSKPLDPRAAEYDNNSPALAEGQFLYTKMNCVGCHAHGGGGMGPALMDNEWRYGGRIDQIAATIAEGRPNGMPSWRGKLTDDQIWKLAAYVRSLSGQPSKDVVSSRADAMSTGSPQTLTPHQAAKSADTAQQ